MLKKIKNVELQELYFAIENIDIIFKGEKIKTKLTFSLDLIKYKIKYIIDAIENITSPDDKYKKYQNEKNDLIKTYALKDSNGEIVFLDEAKTSVQLLRKDKFEEELILLNDKNADAIKQHNNKLEEASVILSQDTEVEIDLVSIEDFPESISNPKMLKLFYPIIKEKQDEKKG